MAVLLPDDCPGVNGPPAGQSVGSIPCIRPTLSGRSRVSQTYGIPPYSRPARGFGIVMQEFIVLYTAITTC